jgi:hypothetical protein
MVLQRFSGFLHFSRISVAVSRRACRAAATLLLVGLAGCASIPGGAPAPVATTPEARQAVVSVRAQARWDAIIKDDMEAAYAFLSPASRQVMSLDQFKSSLRRGSFRAAKIESVTCEGDVCTVRLILTYDHRMMKGISTPIGESWVFEGGQAWHVS